MAQKHDTSFQRKSACHQQNLLLHMTLPSVLLSHLQGRLSQWLHAHKPLLPYKWLYDLPASLRAGHSHRVRLILDNQTSFLHHRNMG